MKAGEIEGIETIESIPEYQQVPIFQKDGEEVKEAPGFLGIRRNDKGTIVSVLSDRYCLVQHKTLAEVLDTVLTSGRIANQEASDFRNFFLYDNGRKFSFTFGFKEYAKIGDETVSPLFRAVNSVDGSLAVKLSFVLFGNGGYYYTGRQMAVREVHKGMVKDIMGMLEKAIMEAIAIFPKLAEAYRQLVGLQLSMVGIREQLIEKGLPERHLKNMNLPETGVMDAWDLYQRMSGYITDLDLLPERKEKFLAAVAKVVIGNAARTSSELAQTWGDLMNIRI